MTTTTTDAPIEGATATDQPDEAASTAVAVRARTTAVVTKDEWATIAQQANTLAKSMMVPREYRAKPHDIVAAALIGRELGLSPMMSLQTMHVIEGRPTLKAQTMVALVRAAGHSISTRELRADDGTFIGVECTGKRANSSDTETASFTMDDATTAGLAQKDNWRKYPDQMTYARAVSKLCRRLYPDVLCGISYTPDEWRDVIEGEVVREQAQPVPQQVEAAPVDDDGETLEGDVIEPPAQHQPHPDMVAAAAPTAEEQARVASVTQAAANAGNLADDDIPFGAPSEANPDEAPWYAGIPTFTIAIPWNDEGVAPHRDVHHLVRLALENALLVTRKAATAGDASAKVDAVFSDPARFPFPQTPTNEYVYGQLRKLEALRLQQAAEAEAQVVA